MRRLLAGRCNRKERNGYGERGTVDDEEKESFGAYLRNLYLFIYFYLYI